MDRQQQEASVIHVYSILDCKDVSSFARKDAALYKEMTNFRLKGGYLPLVYDDSSSQPSEVPRRANPEFALHQYRISCILSDLESLPPFQSNFIEISRAKSMAWAYDHIQTLEQFKMLSWKIHAAERKREVITAKADELARENRRLNDLISRMVVYQGFALGVVGIGIASVAIYMGLIGTSLI